MRAPVFELRRPRTADEWAEYHFIRKSCLFDVYHPWIPYDPTHPDEADPANHSLVLVRDGQVVGTVRIDIKPDRRAVFRMVAVKPEARGGTGSHLLDMAESYAVAKGADTLCLNSVRPAFDFYRRHGFEPGQWDGCTSNPTEIPVTKPLAMVKPLGLAQAA